MYKKYNEDKEAFDEGVFVSEFVNDDEDEDDFDYIREPRTEFEKCLSKIDGVLQQSEQDMQCLGHDLVSLHCLYFTSTYLNVSFNSRPQESVKYAADFATM
jgi:hypothetical protein